MLTGYGSYLISEMIGLSGIMTLFICGAGLSQYALKNMTENSRKTTSIMFESISFISEGFVFTYLGFINKIGMSIINLNIENCNFFFIFAIILAIAFSRFLSIFLLPLILKIFRRA